MWTVLLLKSSSRFNRIFPNWFKSTQLIGKQWRVFWHWQEWWGKSNFCILLLGCRLFSYILWGSATYENRRNILSALVLWNVSGVGFRARRWPSFLPLRALRVSAVSGGISGGSWSRRRSRGMKCAHLTFSCNRYRGRPRWHCSDSSACPPGPVLSPLRSSLRVVTIWALSILSSDGGC